MSLVVATMPKEDPFVNRAQLLKAIKKYPEIWDSNNKLHMCRSVTAPMWNEIAEQFGGHVPTVKLQSIWSQMKYHYHNLVHRQILHKERFTTKWEHFEPMSFMYNITVAKIVGATGSNGSEASEMSPTSLPSPPPLPQSQGRGRPSGSFTWLPPVAPQAEVSVETSPFTGFTGLVPPAAVTVETTTTPLRKPGRPGSLNNSMRGRIIDSIKARPILWAGRQKEQAKGQNRTSAVWKEVAVELGLTPSLVQTRWSIIKQRYVDELQKERHARYGQEHFHSTWEHFDRMSFMREILVKKVDEREQTREHIQEIVSEKQQMQNHHQQAAQQLHQQQQQQQHQHQQLPIHNPHQQQIRYIRSTNTSGLNSSTSLSPSGGGGPLQQTHHHIHHPQLTMCDENELTVHNAHANGVIGSEGVGNSGLVGLLPGHAVVSSTRRRVKNESDLEWDPFEMILHVQAGGTEPPNN
ncbi:G-box-binding factor [Stomoxys calcitrans]|uniref:MADF domain-containing protein n=1 Tax=Stomoxys calcitrans TaxID=35570 RepID=A0A1I8P9Y4_STOCA|nr:G-box-binding factor [Stomoxys calcitrans]